ncbi:RFC checkpoint protein Rad17 [Batrachochytrium dendrobatidis]|nr:RFC checkpoint protein Rad17 [Batrachochytrium dendrobatidis]
MGLGTRRRMSGIPSRSGQRSVQSNRTTPKTTESAITTEIAVVEQVESEDSSTTSAESDDVSTSHIVLTAPVRKRLGNRRVCTRSSTGTIKTTAGSTPKKSSTHTQDIPIHHSDTIHNSTQTTASLFRKLVIPGQLLSQTTLHASAGSSLDKNDSLLDISDHSDTSCDTAVALDSISTMTKAISNSNRITGLEVIGDSIDISCKSTTRSGKTLDINPTQSTLTRTPYRTRPLSGLSLTQSSTRPSQSSTRHHTRFQSQFQSKQTHLVEDIAGFVSDESDVDVQINSIKGGQMAFTSPCKSVSTLVQQQGEFESQLWVDKYKPNSEAEVAIHKKKLKDVRDWLIRAFSGHNGNGRTNGKLLVLSGPSGVGKTAALNVLACELDFEIVEWENPVNINTFQSIWDRHDSLGADGKVERFTSDYVPVLQRFQDFLTSSCKTPALHFTTTSVNSKSKSLTQSNLHTQSYNSPNIASTSKRKIVLIEDWPQLGSMSSRTSVHTALRMYLASKNSAYPLVLIISDTSDVHQSGNTMFKGMGFTDAPITLRTLISPDISSQASYTHIKFNLVAPTILAKALTRIADIEFRSMSKRIHRPSKMMIEWISKSSSGDIRHAIHRLQFLALIDPKSIPLSLQEEPQKYNKRGRNGRSLVSADDTSDRAVCSTLGGDGFLDAGLSKSPHDRSNARGKSSTVRASLDQVDCRDESVSIFQAVGRIRYNKRLDSVAPCEHLLGPTLSCMKRTTLEAVPEDILSLLYVDPDVFTLFSEQNVPSAYTTVEELVLATSYLSDADIYTGRWENRRIMAQYTMSVTARGLLFAHLPSPLVSSLEHVSAHSSENQSRATANSFAKRNEFNQLHKPEAWQCQTRARENRLAIHAGLAAEWTRQYMKMSRLDSLEAFAQNEMVLSHHVSESALWLEIVPFLGLLGRTNKHPPVRNLPGYAKSALASVCGYSLIAGSKLLDEGSYDGGIEYLDAIEDLAHPGHQMDGRPTASAAFSTGTGHGRLEWKDHLALADDDIEEF